MDLLRPIYTETTECQDCYKCVRECPVKAIRLDNNHAYIMPEHCVVCGHCADVCPAGAKKVRNDLNKTIRLIGEGSRVAVSLAPSHASEFRDVPAGALVRALKTLGFAVVSETAVGAEEVSAHMAQWVSSSEKRVFISSACPAVVELVMKYYPEYSGFVAPVLSPLLSHAKLLKRHYGDDVRVVFIGPCIAKKTEADRHAELLDAALTFEDLRSWLEKEGIDLATLEPEPEDVFEPYPAKEGSLYPIDGGMIGGIRAHCETVDAQFMAFSGMEAVKSALAGIGELPDNSRIFLELLACEGGCVNGPKSGSKSSTVVKRSAVIGRSGYGGDFPRKPVIAIDENFLITPVATENFDDTEIKIKLESIGKYSREDELNCGGCGYDSCRDFARAMIAGKAELTMCVSYMRNLAQKKANALIRTMPSGLVIADANLKVIESNANFSALLGDDALLLSEAKPGLEGADLAKLLPKHAHLFRTVLDTGENLLDREIRLNNKIVRTSLFIIEDYRVVGGIFRDISQPAIRKELVIKKAREVIEKNLSTVQQIAYLMGENAAETEVLLNSIIESFGGDDKEENEKDE